MPKAEVGTPKWISNQWKKKGLNKLRWFCGLCQVSCRDANGFQLHLAHEGHLRREVEQAERNKVRDAEAQYRADAYSEAFERSFLRYLVRTKLGQRVRAHEAYRAVNPDDRQHKVMATTCWETLGRFVVDLRNRGEVDAWRDDDGWIVSLNEGAPACEWANLADDDARELHSRITEDDEPKDWREVAAATKRKRDDSDVAFERAEKAVSKMEEDEGKKTERTADGEAPRKPFGAFALPVAARNTTLKMQKEQTKKSVPASSSSSSPSSSSKGDQPPPPPASTNEASSISTWLRAGLVVKATRGQLAGRKAVVVDVDETRGRPRAILESLDKDAARHLVDQRDLETVVPNIGKRVRVLAGDRRGAVATLVSVDYDTYSATLRFPDTDLVTQGVSYDAFCKDRTILT